MKNTISSMSIKPIRLQNITKSFNSKLVYFNDDFKYIGQKKNLKIIKRKNRLLQKIDRDLVIIPLGGLGEIGMNCMLIGIDNRFIMVDCGIMFSDLSNFGIKKIIPDINIISYFKECIESLIITHGHEDHIGAIPWILQTLPNSLNIYLSGFVFNLLTKRIEKNHNSNKLNFNIFGLYKKFSIGPFLCTTFRVTHSIPDCCGFILETKMGNIVHTGDWKIDEYPLDGEVFDRSFIESACKNNTLLLMSDSTNSLSNGRTASEILVQKSLINNIIDSDHRGRVITTQFASNVYRLHAIKKASNLSGRKICFLGTSLNSYLEASLTDGRAPFHPNDLIKENDLKNIEPNKLIIVTTGSQGEQNSTLNLASLDMSSKLNLNTNDTLLYSAKIIPGNDKKVMRMLNRISNHGCKIIYGNDKGLHTSGHAYRDELVEILRIVQPKYFLPVHGETISLSHHSNIALYECGIKNTILLRNGQILVFSNPQDMSVQTNVIGEVNIQKNYQVLHNSVGSYYDVKLQDKFKIGKDGIIIIAIEFNRSNIYSEKNLIKSSIRITSRGILTDRGFLILLLKKIINNILRKCRMDLPTNTMESIINETIGYSCYKLFKTVPDIITIVTDLNIN
mmetsp:Transcript_31567/g.77040  ORF Transcript_31567/g.77040 Transcript_31567/m.77040 type:complete len:620 (-) Transcript_31567:1812-3671(-)